MKQTENIALNRKMLHDYPILKRIIRQVTLINERMSPESFRSCVGNVAMDSNRMFRDKITLIDYLISDLDLGLRIPNSVAPNLKELIYNPTKRLDLDIIDIILQEMKGDLLPFLKSLTFSYARRLEISGVNIKRYIGRKAIRLKEEAFLLEINTKLNKATEELKQEYEVNNSFNNNDFDAFIQKEDDTNMILMGGGLNNTNEKQEESVTYLRNKDEKDISNSPTVIGTKEVFPIQVRPYDGIEFNISKPSGFTINNVHDQFISSVNTLTKIIQTESTFQYDSPNFNKMSMLIIKLSEILFCNPSLTSVLTTVDMDIIRMVRNNIAHFTYKDSTCLPEICTAIGVILKLAYILKNE